MVYYTKQTMVKAPPILLSDKESYDGMHGQFY